VTKSRNEASAQVGNSSEAIDDDGPSPLRNLMTKPVLLSIASYGMLAFSDISFFALQPLFYSTDIEYGGLGFNIPTIGMCLGIYGCMNCVLQASLFPKLVARFGIKRSFVFGMSIFIPLFAMFPVINHFARVSGMSWRIWVLVIFQLLLAVIMDSSFSCAFIYLTASTPNKRSLGSVHGMAQTTASVARTIGPATATSLFAFSLQTQWLGGNAVYLVLITLSCVGVFCVLQLPRRAWTYSNT